MRNEKGLVPIGAARFFALTLTVALAFTVVGAIASCGGDTQAPSSNASHSGTVSKSALPDAIASAVCDNVGSCCSTSGKSFDSTVCRSAVADENRRALNREGDARPFDPNVAAACVDTVASAARACDMAKVYLGTMACTKPHGKLGEPCNETCFEQRLGNACSPVSPGAGADAAPSYFTSCYTNDLLYCDSTGKCTKQAGVGAACTTADECESEWCESGVCASRVAEGGSCGEHGCASGLYCDSWVYTCGKLRTAGAACGSYEQCSSGYCDLPGQGGVVVVVADAAPPADRGTCAPPTPSSTDPQYLAFVCGG